jgi:hypothetical protein
MMPKVIKNERKNYKSVLLIKQSCTSIHSGCKLKGKDLYFSLLASVVPGNYGIKRESG